MLDKYWVRMVKAINRIIQLLVLVVDIIVNKLLETRFGRFTSQNRRKFQSFDAIVVLKIAKITRFNLIPTVSDILRYGSSRRSSIYTFSIPEHLYVLRIELLAI